MQNNFISLESKLLEVMEKLQKVEETNLLKAKEVLTLDDVILLTGLKRTYIYKLTSTNKIPHYRPNGKLLYFDKNEINNWLKRGKVNTEEETEQIALHHSTKKGGQQCY